MLEPHVQLVRTRLVLRLLYRAVQDNTIKQIEAFTSCVCNKCVFVLVPTSCQLPCRVWKLPIHSLGTSLLKWYPMQSMCRWAAFNGGINLQSAPVKGFIKCELCWKASSFSWQEGFVALHSPGHLFAIYTIIPRSAVSPETNGRQTANLTPKRNLFSEDLQGAPLLPPAQCSNVFRGLCFLGQWRQV